MSLNYTYKMQEDELFWDFFLEEDNFNQLIKFTTMEVINPIDFNNFLPPENTIKNWSTLSKRESIIRARMYFTLKYPGYINLTNESLKILYLGLLEYAGYTEQTDELYYTHENVTYLEHSLLGLTVD